MSRRSLPVLLALFGAAAPAQIVNVQPLLGAEKKDGLSLGGDLALDYRSGSIELLLFTATATPTLRQGDHLLFLHLRFEHGYQGDALFLSRDFEHLRYRYRLSEPLMLEAFVQHDRDRFRRLALRALGGAGVRWEPLREGSLRLALGAAYMLEREHVLGTPKTQDEQTLSHRASTSVNLQYRLSDSARAAVTLYLQPRLDDARDTRALGEAEVIATLGGPFSLKATGTVAYDTQPPVGLPPAEIATRVSLHVAL